VGPIRISWEDNEQPRFAMAKCIDLSQNGLRIEAPQPIRPGTVIQLCADRIKLTGSATVRHSDRHGSKYLLGVQLNQAVLDKTIAELEGSPVAVLIENLNRAYQKV
jgi:hypothetical protein